MSGAERDAPAVSRPREATRPRRTVTARPVSAEQKAERDGEGPVSSTALVGRSSDSSGSAAGALRPAPPLVAERAAGDPPRRLETVLASPGRVPGRPLALQCLRDLTRQALEALQQEAFDVVVIGGGITGAGVALDAATRGFSVALVERDDYSCGTSSRSSKMVHGGLRYLQNFDLGLVREALVERQLMVRLAPHLVKPLPFLVPALEGARRDLRIGVGLNMYDVMSLRNPRARRRAEREAALEGGEYWSPDRHRTIDAAEVIELVPALEARNPSSAYLFYDCQTDDSRLVLTVLGEAERFGAVCVNGARAVELIEEKGKAAGVVCEEAESGERFAISAANVVNATGVWADRIRPEELHGEEDLPVIRPSRGTHVLLDRDQLPLNAAVVVPAGEERTIFALPWLGQTLVGTTDNDYEGSLEHPPVSESDVAYLLDAINSFFGTELRGR